MRVEFRWESLKKENKLLISRLNILENEKLNKFGDLITFNKQDLSSFVECKRDGKSVNRNNLYIVSLISLNQF